MESQTAASSEGNFSKGKGKKKQCRENDDEKKDRGQIFTPEEINSFCVLLEKYKKVIECKTSDGSTWKQKRAAWEKLTDDFNAEGLGASRDVTCLQNKWTSMKTKARKEYAAVKRQVKGTGGGEHIPADNIVSSLSRKVNSITSSLTIQGEFDSPDCDSRRSVSKSCAQIFAESSKNKENLPENHQNTQEWSQQGNQDLSSQEEYYNHLIIEEEHYEGYLNNMLAESQSSGVEAVSEEAPPPNEASDWSTYTPAMLRTPRHDALRASSSTEKPAGKRNNKRSFELHNRNLTLKQSLLEKQEKYFSALLRMQEADEERKKMESQWMIKKQKLEEEEYALRIQKSQEFWDLKIKNEAEKFKRQKKFDEHMHFLNVKAVSGEKEEEITFDCCKE